MDFDALAHRCAPLVAVETARALVQIESGFDPWAIHVKAGQLEHQPKSKPQAIATAKALQKAGWDFDLGLAQINVRSLERLGVTVSSAFDPCANLRLMQRLLGDCFARAKRWDGNEQTALQKALSCYNTGSLKNGFALGYVGRALQAARSNTKSP